MSYTYELHRTTKPLNESYTLEDLQQLTTIQLREICQREKIVIGVAYKLDRPYIISTILKYRGAKLFTFITTFDPRCFDSVLTKFYDYLTFIDRSKLIQVPTNITLYKNLDTKLCDNYIVKGLSICESNVFLLDDKTKICGILNLKKEGDDFFIICNHDLLSK
ncbi:MAG: hypothetical protein FWC47_01115, partial [Oscillospiraceae bacterium]|nr:hypothetical protein [Oscillospiraceae bacterium]